MSGLISNALNENEEFQTYLSATLNCFVTGEVNQLTC